MTQIEAARKNIVTKEMRQTARDEKIPLPLLLRGIKTGEIVIPKNKNRKITKTCGIGRPLRIKVNANIGTSPVHMRIEEETAKLRAAEKYGADTIMDLSLGSILNRVRRRILEESSVPLGTVPLYQVGYALSRKKRRLEQMTIRDILDVIQEQAEEGVDFMTVHCGVTQKALERMEKEKRVLNVVSRGGSMLVAWMKKNRKENLMYEHFDEILKIARKHDVTLSLGDGFRPGALVDATDRAQVQELILLAELAEEALSAGVQSMIEGPGHIPLNEIVTNIQLQKSLCHNAPFYVLGPLVTDIAPGYDHITSAIGGALAAFAGADFLCYVTPAEHLKLPSAEDVKLGTIASRIAAHAADLARGRESAWEKDRAMAVARRELDWKKQFALSLDPEKCRQYRNMSEAGKKDFCSMCAEFCAIKQLNEVLP